MQPLAPPDLQLEPLVVSCLRALVVEGGRATHHRSSLPSMVAYQPAATGTGADVSLMGDTFLLQVAKDDLGSTIAMAMTMLNREEPRSTRNIRDRSQHGLPC